jgi:hypothetical protein
MLILTTAVLSTLALAACNQPTESPSAPAAADNAIDAVAIDKNAPPPASVVQAPRPARAAPAPAPAPAPATDAAEEVAAPAEAATEDMMAGPSPEVRDMAKEKAEATNLRPN